MSNTTRESQINVWKRSLGEAQELVTQFTANPALLETCARFTQELIDLYERGGNLFISGNGGSHCDSMHFAEEMTGRFKKNRKPLGALALGDASHLTCVANDFGFEHVFSRQLEGLGRKGDLYVGISTSGESQNVMNAITSAKSLGIRTVGLLGKTGGKIKEMVDLPIVVPSHTTERIQEMHIKIIHITIESAERVLFPDLWR